jgi:hypothetical protein
MNMVKSEYEPSTDSVRCVYQIVLLHSVDSGSSSGNAFT